MEGHNWNDYDTRFSSPLSCSLFWIDGLKYLLDWGVDSRPALIMALEAGLSSALSLLVTYDCPAFFMVPFWTPFWTRKEHETSLLAPHAYSDSTLRIVLPHVARTRRLLSEHGLRLLPESWERHHLQRITSRGVLLDRHALAIWNALESGNHHPPAFLWPGTAVTVYHTLTKFGVYDCDVKTMAECLWEAGFRDINVADSEGNTPIDFAFSRCLFDTCTFFLSKGAQPPPDALWMSIRSLPSTNSLDVAPPRWMTKRFPPLDHDGCTCFCSVSGCTPASLLVRRRALGHLPQRRIIDMFARTLPPGLREECHMAHMRLEIFERLGMGHTCCREPADRYWTAVRSEAEIPPMDEIREIQTEDRILHHVLEDCMALLENLRQCFEGRFRDYLSGVRASMSLLLPHGDSIEDASLVGVKRASSMDEDLASSDLSGWVDADMVRAIVSHYQQVYACLEFYMETNLQSGLSREVFDYVPELEEITQTCENLVNWVPSRLGRRYMGYDRLYPDVGVTGRFRADKKKIFNDLVHDDAIPLFVARVIRDLTIDHPDRIPQEILDLLEREGIIREDKLTAHGSVELENNFLEGIDMLAL